MRKAQKVVTLSQVSFVEAAISRELLMKRSKCHCKLNLHGSSGLTRGASTFPRRVRRSGYVTRTEEQQDNEQTFGLADQTPRGNENSSLMSSKDISPFHCVSALWSRGQQSSD